MRRGYSHYRDQQVLTASPMQLVVHCCDQVIRSMRLAREAQAGNDLATRDRELDRAYGLVGELLSSLRDEGGQITSNLKSLYVYVLQRILEASVGRDPALLDEPIRILGELRGAWVQVAEGRAAPEGARDDSAADALDRAVAP